MELAYLPADRGGWTVFVHGSTMLAVEGRAKPERLQALWSLIKSETAPGKLLDELGAESRLRRLLRCSRVRERPR